MMNRKQKICLWVGAFILVIVTIYPHWIYKDYSTGKYSYHWRGFILDKRSSNYGIYRINKVRLYVEAGITVALTVSLAYALKDEKQKRRAIQRVNRDNSKRKESP